MPNLTEKRMKVCYKPVTFTKVDIQIETNVMKKYIFPLLLIGLVSCGSDNSAKKATKEQSTIVKHLKNEAEMDAQVLALKKITEASGLVANSLHYDKADGTIIEVLGHLDTSNVIQILEEQFSDGNGKTNGVRYYYLNNGKTFVTQELIDQIDGTNPAVFIDRISYYDEKGNVIKTKMRSASFEDDIYPLPYKAAPLHSVNSERAMNALNSKGEFETTFQGFANQDLFSYLIVGPNDPDGFTTALRLDYKDQLVNILFSDPKKYLGAKIQVNFEVHEDRGFEFQVYAGGKFVD
jgi:Ni,Fe-hydrogenase maturation factor